MSFLYAFWKPIVLVVVVIGLAIAVGVAKHRYDEGKRDEGRAEVQGQWDLAKAAALKANTEQEQRWQGERDAREKAEKERDDERTKRKGHLAMMSSLPAASAVIARCMVGTAVYQVGFVASIQGKKSCGRKLGGHTADPRAVNGASRPPTRP